jgi:uncharacterized protein YgbK (DUF1537 family)
VPASDVAAGLPGASRVVVLDDDPTGTQVVRGVPVLTRWARADIDWAMSMPTPGFYVLTNTRALSQDDAARRNREVAETCLEAARLRGVGVVFASRSDSTLRGHFPLETNVLAEVSRRHGTPVSGVILTPAYIDAGRVTLDGTQWLRSPGGLTPVGQSEFARDATFGYRSSYLPDWVEEKSHGRVRATEVRVIDVDRVREGPERVADLLFGAPDGSVIAVDAVTDEDLRVLAKAVLGVERRGRNFLYRTGPSFVRARLGQGTHPPLSRDELATIVGPDAGVGLVVAGSHTGLTSRQLEALVRARPVRTLELDVAAVLDGQPDSYIGQLAARAVRALAEGTVVLSTSREVVRGHDGQESLDISRRVSAALADTVGRIVHERRPAYVVAKGGITSSDIATSALGIERAWVAGTLLPGIVSLWTAEDGAAARLPYVVFAGNVGDEDSLAEAVSRLEDR